MTAPNWLATCTAASPIATGDLPWVVLGIVLVTGLWAWMAQAAFIVICGHDEPETPPTFAVADARDEAVAWVAP